MVAGNEGTFWFLLVIGSMLLCPAGFLCLDVGLTRARQRRRLTFKYLLGLAIAFLGYLLLGYGLMFGRSAGGWFGSPDLAAAWQTGDGANSAQLLLQTLLAVTTIAAALLTAPSRLRPAIYPWLALLLATLIYPLAGHWAEQGWLRQVGFIDFGGSMLIHGVAAGASLALALLAERQPSHDHPHPTNLPLAGLGVLLLWLGWLGLHFSRLVLSAWPPFDFALTTLIAAATGLLAGVLGRRFWSARTTVTAAIHGCLAGLIASSAGLPLYSPLAALLVGGGGALASLLVSRFLARRHIAGATSLLPAQMGASVWGTLAVALLATPSEGSWLSQLGAQLQGILAIGGWTFLCTTLCFLLLEMFQPLFFSGVERINLPDTLPLPTSSQPEQTATDPAAPMAKPAAPPPQPVVASAEPAPPTVGHLALSADMLIVRTADEATRRMFSYPGNTLVGETANFFLRAHEQGDSLAQLAMFLEDAARHRQPVHMIGMRSDGRRFNLTATVAAVVEERSPIYRLTLKPSLIAAPTTFAL